MKFRTTLEQWATLRAVERSGSIQAAAQYLNKSHTTLIYAIRKLEGQLGLSLVEIKARRAVLTSAGKSILRRADSMLEQAQQLEVIGRQLSAGTETDIIFSVDHLCNKQWILPTLKAFYHQNPTTSVQLLETSMSSTTEVVNSKQSDVAIINIPVTNYSADLFGATSIVPVVSRDHHLAHKQVLCLSDLETEIQIVIKDLGNIADDKKMNVGWLKSQQRLTVDSFEQALEAVLAGIGFCRLPDFIVNRASNQLVTLLLENSNIYQIPSHITLPKGEDSGPASRMLYSMLLASAQERLAGIN